MKHFKSLSVPLRDSDRPTIPSVCWGLSNFDWTTTSIRACCFIRWTLIRLWTTWHYLRRGRRSSWLGLYCIRTYFNIGILYICYIWRHLKILSISSEVDPHLCLHYIRPRIVRFLCYPCWLPNFVSFAPKSHSFSSL